MQTKKLPFKFLVFVSLFCFLVSSKIISQGLTKIDNLEKVKRITQSTIIAPAEYTPKEFVGKYSAQQLKKFGSTVQSSTTATKTLLIEDAYPWNTDIIDQKLDESEIEYDKILSSNLANVDFSAYAAIVVANDQPQTCYNNLVLLTPKINSFLQNGGAIVYLVAGMGWNGGNPSSLALPGGTKVINDFEMDNKVVDPSNAMVSGVPSILKSNYASHTHLENYPSSTSVVITTPDGYATLIRYSYGKGNIIVSGMTLEYGANNNIDGFDTLLNNILGYSSKIGSHSPILAGIENTKLYYGNRTNLKNVSTSITLSGTSTCTSAVIKIAENYEKGKDVLLLNPGTGLRSSFNINTGTLTVTGYAPLATYQKVLRNIIYIYISNVMISPATQDKKIELILYNGTLSSNIVSRWITFRSLGKSEEENSGSQLPVTFRLDQNYPNPFNPVTNIRFAIPQQGFTTMKVYNMLGQEVATLMNEDLIAGTYEVQFNGASLASGTYFYRLTSGSYVETKKFILMK